VLRKRSGEHLQVTVGGQAPILHGSPKTGQPMDSDSISRVELGMKGCLKDLVSPETRGSLRCVLGANAPGRAESRQRS